MQEFNNSTQQNNLTEGYNNTLANPKVQGLDKVKDTITHKLHDAADALREKTQTFSNKNPEVANYGNQAAEWLNRSADYIENINPQQVKKDVENQIRHNPGRSLLIAAGVGLVLGALLRRR
jgi:ElaB/YqjD/DUF883 family membrane-anchored ribosome-binding protein